MARIKEKVQYDASMPTNSYADLVRKLLEDYSSASSFPFWFLGSACIILLLLIGLNYSKENVYFPFFVQDKNGLLGLTIQSSNSATLKFYDFFGKNKISFNDVLKLFILIFLVLMFFKTIWHWLKKCALKSFSVVTFLAPSIGRGINRIVKKIPQKYKLKKWLAEPLPMGTMQGARIYPQLRKKIPKEVRNFKYISFTIHILGDFSHWRAGIFITSFDSSKDYVFHIYKNENDNRILSKMTKRIFAEGHKNESDKVLQIDNVDNILFKVENVGKNIYALKINDVEYDRYQIPKEDFKFVEIGGWADDRSYKIEFDDIDFLG